MAGGEFLRRKRRNKAARPELDLLAPIFRAKQSLASRKSENSGEL
jgi:hypothetical protein